MGAPFKRSPAIGTPHLYVHEILSKLTRYAGIAEAIPGAQVTHLKRPHTAMIPDAKRLMTLQTMPAMRLRRGAPVAFRQVRIVSVQAARAPLLR